MEPTDEVQNHAGANFAVDEGLSWLAEGQMPRKSISGFAEAGAAMARQLDDNDLLNLFSAVGRVVSKRFLLKRPCLDRWQLVVDYLTSAMAFAPREQFRVLYLDKRNNLIC
jgi:DNA repair protein RadC